MPKTDRFSERLDDTLGEIGRLITDLVNLNRLTALPGKGAFDLDLAQTEPPVGLMFLEINGFKNINSVYGHEGGDWALDEVARRMDEFASGHEGAVAYHLSGDEFALAVNGVARTAFDDLAKALKRAVESEPFALPGGKETSEGEVTVAVAAIRVHEPSSREDVRRAWELLEELTEFQKARGLAADAALAWKLRHDSDFIAYQEQVRTTRRHRFRCGMCGSEGYVGFTAEAAQCSTCRALLPAQGDSAPKTV